MPCPIMPLLRLLKLLVTTIAMSCCKRAIELVAVIAKQWRKYKIKDNKCYKFNIQHNKTPFAYIFSSFLMVVELRALWETYVPSAVTIGPPLDLLPTISSSSSSCSPACLRSSEATIGICKRKTKRGKKRGRENHY